jgi:hypothetical protein
MRRMKLRIRASFALSASLLAAAAAVTLGACGSDEASPSPPTPPAAGASGATAGSAGASGGGAGLGGAAGTAGSGGLSSGAGGDAGQSGSGGAAGQSGCQVDADCPAVLSTIPASCAAAKCNGGVCSFVAVDADADGHGTSRCKSNDPAFTVTLGDDCDDTDKDISPAGWDGPAGEGKPNHCNDGIDQDCSGVDDDQKLADGSTCVCTPGDVDAACSTNDAGKAVTFPVLTDGKPVGTCQLGSRTCLAGGKWGPCTGLKEPTTETCDQLDNDCNGVVDDNPVDQQFWFWDADGDLHGAADCAPVKACKDAPPTAPPTGCASATCQAPNCPNPSWKIGAAIAGDDCDDTTNRRHPGAVETCDKIDNDCNGLVDDGPEVGGQPSNVCECEAGGPATPCFTGPAGLSLEAPSACRAGTTACKADGTPGECVGQILPSSDLCNGIDDDCDGQVDEGYAAGEPCNLGNGVGACAGGGKNTCTAAGTNTTCVSVDGGIGGTAFHQTPAPTATGGGATGPGTSFDWSCDGSVEHAIFAGDTFIASLDVAPQLGSLQRTTIQCNDTTALKKLCAGRSKALCNVVDDYAFVALCYDGAQPSGPVCGQAGKAVACSYSDPEPGNPAKCSGIGTTDVVVRCR